MHPGGGLARHAGLTAIDAVDPAALHMVEDEDAAGAQNVGDEALGLGVIDLTHLVIVPEIAHRAALLDQREPLVVEPDFVRNRPHVVDPHHMRLVNHVGRRIGRAGLVGVIARPFGHRHDVIQLGFDIRQAVGGAHRDPPLNR